MCKSCRHLAKHSNYTYKTKAQHCERRLVSLYMVCLRHKGGNLTAVPFIPTRFMFYFNASRQHECRNDIHDSVNALVLSKGIDYKKTLCRIPPLKYGIIERKLHIYIQQHTKTSFESLR